MFSLVKKKYFYTYFSILAILTAKSDSTMGATKYTFNIPNFELRQEFADIINAQIKHSNCKIYKELLDKLHKKLHVSALKAIEEGDGEKL